VYEGLLLLTSKTGERTQRWRLTIRQPAHSPPSACARGIACARLAKRQPAGAPMPSLVLSLSEPWKSRTDAHDKAQFRREQRKHLDRAR